VARLTGLEPATPGVTGRYSNQLSYNRSLPARDAPSVMRVLCVRAGPVKHRRGEKKAFFALLIPGGPGGPLGIDV
jgi:hypothetical protein